MCLHSSLSIFIQSSSSRHCLTRIAPAPNMCISQMFRNFGFSIVDFISMVNSSGLPSIVMCMACLAVFWFVLA